VSGKTHLIYLKIDNTLFKAIHDLFFVNCYKKNLCEVSSFKNLVLYLYLFTFLSLIDKKLFGFKKFSVFLTLLHIFNISRLFSSLRYLHC
jgi:hypothetical protein